MAESTHALAEWSDLPDDVLLELYFRLVSVDDVIRLALTCKACYKIFQSGRWAKDVVLWFEREQQNLCSSCIVERFAESIRSLTLKIDQFPIPNRNAAVHTLESLSRDERSVKLAKLSIQFVGDNPLFYQGFEFIDALLALFASKREQFETIDLRKLQINVDDRFLNLLAANHCTRLAYLDLQNDQLICAITERCVEHLVDRCRNLHDLRILHYCLSSKALLVLAETNRRPLDHLSILCRRQDIYYAGELSEQAWTALTGSWPLLEVTLKFDHTIELWKIREIMKPEIPCSNLFLETYTQVYPELDIASDSYGTVLRKLVVHTQADPELDQALLLLASRCPNVEALHVMCTLDLSTIEQIRRMLPKLKSHTLKNVMEPHPWVGDLALDEIMLRCSR